jgi:hypothetical protein
MVKIKKISFISLIIMSVYCSSSIAFDLDDLKGLADDMKKNIEETGDALQKDIDDSSKNNQENPEEESNQPKVAEPKVVEPKVAAPKKVIPKKQDVSKKGKGIASKSKTKFKLYSKEDKMMGTKSLYAVNTSSDGVGKIETKFSCDKNVISITFTTFDTSFVSKRDDLGVAAAGKRRLNEKMLPGGRYSFFPGFVMGRSKEFNNVWEADKAHAKNSQLFACLREDSSIFTCQNGAGFYSKGTVQIYDLAYSFLTSSGEDFFIDIPPYNPVIQDVIKSCSN